MCHQDKEEIAEKTTGHQSQQIKDRSRGSQLPLQEQNQKYLQNMGTIIYLKGSAATLIKRLEGSNNPTLEGAENKEDKIKKLLKQRDPVYEKFADIKVVTGVKPFDELIAEIEEKLKA